MAQVMIAFLFGSFFLYNMLYKMRPDGSRLGVFSLVFWGYGMSLVSLLDYMGVASQIHSTIFLTMTIISAILFLTGIRISYVRGTGSHRDAFKKGVRSYGKFLLFCVGVVLVIVLLNKLGYLY